MTVARRCSECGTSLEGKGPQAKTCGPNCRGKRSRRLKRVKKENGEKSAMPQHQREITEAVERKQNDVAHELLVEEMRPVVRESITEDTLNAIGKMVGLTPIAIAAITADLASEDATIRQRAYTLILKYTVGHQAIVRPPDEDRTQPIQVNFALPRPDKTDGGRDRQDRSEDVEDSGSGLGEASEVLDVDAVEIRTCDTCGKEAPVDDFAANSTRCLDCYAKQRARADAFLKDNA